MKFSIRITFIVVILVCTVNYYSKSQSTIHNTANESRKEIEAINTRIEQLYLTEDINSLVSLYSAKLTFFPEYKPAIFDITKLSGFLNDWFKAGNINAYKKKIYTVEAISDHILEIGTFNLGYSSIHNAQGEYKGKYMIVWKRDKEGELSIVSEAMGSDTYIEPEVVPYATVNMEESHFASKHTNVSKELLDDIEEFDAVLLKAVAEGDGDARAKGFTEDAILMGNFDSIRVGMKSIRPKMLNTYKPESSYIVKHTYSRIIDLGDYVLVNGHYKGGPADPGKGGPFEGKMSNLMKRSQNGKLLMYRQLGNRDKK